VVVQAVGEGHALDAVHLHGPEQIEANRARFGYRGWPGRAKDSAGRPAVLPGPSPCWWIRIPRKRKGNWEMRFGGRPEEICFTVW
jgi:hypothetical protein